MLHHVSIGGQQRCVKDPSTSSIDTGANICRPAINHAVLVMAVGLVVDYVVHVVHYALHQVRSRPTCTPLVLHDNIQRGQTKFQPIICEKTLEQDWNLPTQSVILSLDRVSSDGSPSLAREMRRLSFVRRIHHLVRIKRQTRMDKGRSPLGIRNAKSPMRLEKSDPPSFWARARHSWVFYQPPWEITTSSRSSSRCFL